VYYAIHSAYIQIYMEKPGRTLQKEGDRANRHASLYRSIPVNPSFTGLPPQVDDHCPEQAVAHDYCDDHAVPADEQLTGLGLGCRSTDVKPTAEGREPDRGHDAERGDAHDGERQHDDDAPVAPVPGVAGVVELLAGDGGLGAERGTDRGVAPAGQQQECERTEASDAKAHAQGPAVLLSLGFLFGPPGVQLVLVSLEQRAERFGARSH